MAFTGGQFGPEAIVDAQGNALVGATVTVPNGYTATLDAHANLTVTGPASDSVAITVVAPGAVPVSTALTVRVEPLVSELNTKLATGGGGAVSSVAGRTGIVVLTSTDLTDVASLATAAALATTNSNVTANTSALASKAASDLSNVTPATGRAALGLGTAATQPASAFDLAGAAAAVTPTSIGAATAAALATETTNRTNADALLIPLTQKGAASGVASLDSGGKIPAVQLPAIAMNTVWPAVASQAAMLALAAQPGDVAVRSDVVANYMLASLPASTLANWVVLDDATGAVTSVAGRTGNVTLAVADVTGAGKLAGPNAWTGTQDFTGATVTGIAGGAVSSVAGRTGAVVLAAADVSGAVPRSGGTSTNAASLPFVNALDYGADPTGVADATSALLAAHNALPAAGGTVILPPGTYLGTLPTRTANKRVTWWANGATLKIPAGGTGLKITTGGGSGAIGGGLVGLTIDGQSSSTTIGLLIEDSHRQAIEHVRIVNCGTGIRFHNSVAATGTEGNVLSDVYIDACTIGLDFLAEVGASNSFDETVILSVGVNNCATGIRVTGDSALVPHLFRGVFVNVTVWVPVNGIGFAANFNMGYFRAFIGFESLNGASNTIGFQVGANANSALSADLTFGWANTFTTKVDTSLNSTLPIVWREGSGVVGAGGSGAQDAMRARILGDTSDRIKLVAGSTGSAGIYLGPGSTSTDVQLTRDVAGRWKTPNQIQVTDGVATKSISGAGKIVPADADFTVAPLNSTLAMVRDSTSGLSYLAVRDSGVWKSVQVAANAAPYETAGAVASEAATARAAEALAAQKSANLSDLANAATARTNLGLGSAATQPSSAFAPAGSTAPGAPAVYGDGSDGAAAFDAASAVPGTTRASAAYTATRDLYFTTATFTANATLDMAGFRLHVSGTLTVGAGSVISRDGNSASGVTGGAQAPAQTLGYGGVGANGGTGVAGSTGTGQSGSLGGTGGAGGAATGSGVGGGPGGAALGVAANVGTPRSLQGATIMRTMADASSNLWRGGQGGGGGTAVASSIGGGSGGGGGVLAIYASVLVNNGTLRAKGGDGAAASGTGTGAGGGGGGGGGLIVLVYNTTSGTGTTSVPGGAGGAGQGVGSAGAAGTAGQVFTVVN